MAEKKKTLSVDPWSVIKYPLLSEKAIAKIESENKLVFVTERRATKKQIKWAIEKAFSVKVDHVTTMINQKGEKRAWVKLAKEFSASDIATRLGML